MNSSSQWQKLNRYVREHPEWRGNEDLLLDPPTDDEALREYPELAGSDVLGARCRNGLPAILVYYVSRRNGSSHRFAEMCACQSPPGCMTDAIYFAGQPQLCDQFASDAQFKTVLGIAKKHGYKPNMHDVYVPGLARFQGDPEAFVPQSGGRGYIRRLCERRGWECDGAVKVSGRIDDPGPDKPLGDDIVRELVREERKKGSTEPAGELVSKVIDEHGMK